MPATTFLPNASTQLKLRCCMPASPQGTLCTQARVSAQFRTKEIEAVLPVPSQ